MVHSAAEGGFSCAFGFCDWLCLDFECDYFLRFFWTVSSYWPATYLDSDTEKLAGVRLYWSLCISQNSSIQHRCPILEAGA
jgi:hypothetical protein